MALRGALALFEVGALAYAIVFSLRAPHEKGALPEEALAAALTRVFPARFARFLATECIILRSIFPWRRAESSGRSFGYTAESLFRLIVLSYPVLILGDFALTFTLIPRSWVALHVIHAALAAYGFVWLVGLYRTMLLRPHTVEDGVLRLHRGVLASATIPLEAIARVESVDEDAKVEGRPARFDLRGAPRFLLSLKAPAKVTGFFGGREADRLVVSADDAAGLRAALAPAGARTS